MGPRRVASRPFARLPCPVTRHVSVSHAVMSPSWTGSAQRLLGRRTGISCKVRGAWEAPSGPGAGQAGWTAEEVHGHG